MDGRTHTVTGAHTDTSTGKCVVIVDDKRTTAQISRCLLVWWARKYTKRYPASISLYLHAYLSVCVLFMPVSKRKENGDTRTEEGKEEEEAAAATATARAYRHNIILRTVAR